QKPAKKPKKEEKSFADTVMDNINYIAGGAALLLLAALGLSRRRKNNEAGTTVIAEPSVLGVPNQAAHSLYAEAGGQSVDTSNSVFNSSFAPSASQLDTNEVDPVAEADVYIAYGRDAQAEEILKEALRTNPERHAVRLKLLDIYAARKDLRAFEAQAGELYGITRGQGDEWAQAAALGLTIDPANPLYTSASGAGPLAPSPSPQERDQKSLLSQQLEDAFRGGAPAAAAIGAGAAYAAIDQDEQLDSTAVPAAEQRHEDNSLDFDLGGLSFEPVSDHAANANANANAADAGGGDATAVPDLDFALDPITPADVTAAPAPAAEEPFDLAFDMSFGEPEAVAASESQETPATTAADHHDVDLAGLAAEFDLPPLPALAEDEVPAIEQDPLFDLDAMDFGQPATPAAPAAVAEATPFHEEVPPIRVAPAAASVADDPLFDLDAMDFGSPAEAAPAAPAPAPAQLSVEPFEFDAPPAAAPVEPAFDLADIDLELPAIEQPAPPPEAADALEPGAMSPEHMEMETKLDLAIAYQEIGDKDGARELLDEVIKGGSSEQVGKASAMRQLLA
ncbi:MAG: FimV/HubP family polar landmark protein, partial [Telluria sp.]